MDYRAWPKHDAVLKVSDSPWLKLISNFGQKKERKKDRTIKLTY